jgi:valyl-tRNA synthetase
MRKLWNASRFISLQLEGFNQDLQIQPSILDKWLLSHLERVIQKATEAMENYQFNNALNEVRDFTWHLLCDHYIEDVKHRLYQESTSRRAAQFTLYTAMYRVLQLLAPFCPHITEEVYQYLFSPVNGQSIHLTRWPETDQKIIDETAESEGDMIVAVIRDVRKEKASRGLSLNAELRDLTIHTADESIQKTLEKVSEDISATLKASEMKVLLGRGSGATVDGYPQISFSFSSTVA